MSEAYVGVAEVSAHLKESVPTVQNWARLGKIPAIKPGKTWKFRLTDVDEFLNRTVDPWKQSAQSRGRKRST